MLHATGAALLAACASGYAAGEAARGERIFHGREAVTARLAGHDRALPSQVARCAACHAAVRSPGPVQEDLAPPLQRETLTRAMPRRGGKPYAYDRESFCSTVRTGTDPQFVVLRRAMPRFDVSREQCAALWTYLTEQEHGRRH